MIGMGGYTGQPTPTPATVAAYVCPKQGACNATKAALAASEKALIDERDSRQEREERLQLLEDTISGRVGFPAAERARLEERVKASCLREEIQRNANDHLEEECAKLRQQKRIDDARITDLYRRLGESRPA